MLGDAPIGLDVGSKWIKACQELGRGRVATACFPRLEAGAALSAVEAQRIASVLMRRGFRGERVVVAATSARSVELELPSSVGAGMLSAAARMEAARVLRLDPWSFELALWPLPRPARAAGDTTSFAGAALPHEEAMAIVSPLEEIGLEVAGIDLGGGALVRSCAGVLGVGPMGVVLDIGWSGISIIVVLGGAAVYERRLPDLGIGQLCAQVGEELSLEPDRAELVVRRSLTMPGEAVHEAVLARMTAMSQWLGQEIEVSMEYAWHRYGDAGQGVIAVAGGGAGLRGLDLIGRTLDMRVVPLEVPSTPTVPGGAILASAAGLASVVRRKERAA